ncbi:sulfatase-like hydrolase/transferase [Natrinema sp. LN54]|uniref:sulfatase-like hydrolase/transferase n=1 Tax=Natrinema sp. LN54 TaxID=3458705 RepID=UPI004035C9E5
MTNVALVVLDTLRRDAFEEYFDWLPGVRYPHAFSPGHYTIPAHAGLFTGYYASEVGVHAKSESLDCDTSVLAERLRDHGYTTRGFSANVLLSPWNEWDRGFDEYELGWRARAAAPGVFNWSEELDQLSDVSRVERHLRAVWKCVRSGSPTLPSLDVAWHIKNADHDGAPEALDYVSSTSFGEDEFLFMNLMEAHLPYDPPADYRTVSSTDFEDTSTTLLGGDTDCRILREAYDDCVRYLSGMYERIFEELRRDFDYIITVSDHGELFGEHDARGHWHGVYPELTNVVFTVWNGESEVEYREDCLSLLDAHRTILSLTDVEGVESRGRDLYSDLTEAVWLTESHGLRPSRIDALEADGFARDEIDRHDTPLYGIAAGGYYGWQTVDGFEETGRSPLDEPETRLEEELTNRDVKSVSTPDTADISQNTRQQLEDLGYM